MDDDFVTDAQAEDEFEAVAAMLAGNSMQPQTNGSVPPEQTGRDAKPAAVVYSQIRSLARGTTPAVDGALLGPLGHRHELVLDGDEEGTPIVINSEFGASVKREPEAPEAELTLLSAVKVRKMKKKQKGPP